MKRVAWVFSLSVAVIASSLISCDRADNARTRPPAATPSGGAAPTPAASQSTPTPSGTAELEKTARAFVALLAKGDFAGAVAQFDANMKRALPESKLRETWNALISQIGKFKRAGSTRTDTAAGYRIVFVTCEFENSKIDVKIAFDQSGQVAGLFFVPSGA